MRIKTHYRIGMYGWNGVSVYSEAQSKVGKQMAYAIQDKWGDAAVVGFSQVPDTLFKAQHVLGISPLEMNVVMNLISFWWKAADQPFPSTASIAKRMGVQPRTVQKTIKGLVDRGLIGRTAIAGKGVGRVKYDLRPLVSSVEALARKDPRFKKMASEHDEAV